MSDELRPTSRRVLYRGESTKTFCVDFSGYGPVAAGNILSGATATFSSGVAALTGAMNLGAAQVISADFVQYDADGNEADTVPAGKGVKFTITPPAVGGAKGVVVVTVTVLTSSGSREAARIEFEVL